MESKKGIFICYIGFGISFILLIFRAFKGFAWNDECFYIATANRFFLGDRVLVDDWYHAQSFCVIILPLVWLYRTVFGGTEGIIVSFRIAYIVFSGIISGYMFASLKRYSSLWVAFVAAVLNLYYVKLGIATFSYNTIALEMLLLSGMLIYNQIESKTLQIGKVVLSGTAYAMVILANPFFVLGQAFIILGMAVYGGLNKKRIRDVWKIYLWHLLGIILPAIPIFIWWIKDVTLNEVYSCLQNMWNISDMESNKGLVHRIFSSGWQVIKQYRYTIIPYCVLLLTSIRYAVKRLNNPNFVRIVLLLQMIILYVNIFLSGSGKYMGLSFIAFTMFGFNLYFLLDRDRINKFIYWYVIGIAAAFLFFISSDTGIVCVASGCLVSSIGVLLCIQEYMGCMVDNQSKAMTLKILMLGAVVLVVISTAVFRLTYVFRDGGIKDLNYKIESGPAKGLYTLQANKQEYDLVYRAVKDNVNDEDTFFVTKFAPWAYLCTDAACGNYTTWMTGYDDKMMGNYYQMFPDRIPNKILILNEEIGYKNDNNPRGGPLEEIVTEGKYEEKALDCGLLLVR